MATVKTKPRSDDPKEQMIVSKIRREIFQRRWAQRALARVKNLQIEYLKNMIAHIDRPTFVHDSTQEVLQKIAKLFRSEIVVGAEYLKKLPHGATAFICTNHLGIYKLTGFNPKEELDVDIRGYDLICPLMSHASLLPVAKALGSNLYFIAADYPGVFGAIHTAAEFIYVPPFAVQKKRKEVVQKQIEKLLNTHSNAAIVNFPEGRTSGKYSGLGPYDLDPFKTGAYVIAAFLKIPIVPVAQYFNQHKGFQLRVFKPFIPRSSNFRRYARHNQREMQIWLNTRRLVDSS